MKIQKTFNGNTFLDQIIKNSLIESDLVKYEAYEFRTYYGNDETIFEAPGYEIPSTTLTRFPFKEYHTDLDTIEKLSSQMLEETANILINAIIILEENCNAKSNKIGLYCLSNPKYSLYKKAPEPGISNDGNSKLEKSWNLMMNCLPRLLSDGTSTVEISNKYNLPFNSVNEYLQEWQLKGLAELTHKKISRGENE